MARAVLVVADASFIPMTLGRDHHLWPNRASWEYDENLAASTFTWAQRVDNADGTTYRGAPAPSQAPGGDPPVMMVQVEVAEGARGLREGIVSATIAAVRQAATFAERGGVVALLLGGHGDAQIDTTSTWVDLAPARHLRVTVEAVERAAAAAASSASDLESTALQDYGDALRYGGRRARRGSAAPAPIGIARVDLYACHLGVGTEGQRMLDALSALWGVTVRGLAGYMGICGVTEARGPSATVGDPFMLVTPPRRGQNRATCPEGVTRATPNVFVDRLPGEGDRVFGTDTPIWTTSRPRGRR